MKKETIYLCGNSLGPQPKNCKSYVEEVLGEWEEEGVEGWHSERAAWLQKDASVIPPLANIVGALRDEVVIMNSLTVNLHIMFAHFYQPDQGKRYKVLMEKGAFPSDTIAVKNQIMLRGLNPKDALIQVETEEELFATLEQNGEEISLVWIEALNYLTGRVLDVQKLANMAHEKGCLLGLDLAHAAGNIRLELHKWEVDFAVWCTYKYLNSGPGGVGACFVHEKHEGNVKRRVRLGGWWGQDVDLRFIMDSENPMAHGASGFHVSTPSMLSLACLKASLVIYEEAGMDRFEAKSRLLTGYLEALLKELLPQSVTIVTPNDKAKRGCQLTLTFETSDGGGAKAVLSKLKEAGVICDFREPKCLRVAPNPLYNTFQDVFNFVTNLKNIL